MIGRGRSLFCTVGFAGILWGCASTSPGPLVDDASKLVASRSGYRVTWLSGGKEDDDARKAVSQLVAADLTLDAAIRVSLLSNRSLQASYEELGIAQADLVQAGLLKNPTLGGDYAFPLNPSRGGAEFGLNLSTDLLQLFTMVARKDVAGAVVEGAKYRVASEVLRHIYEVKSAYYAAQAAQQMYAMRAIVTEAAEAAVELSRRQHEGGTISDLDLANEEALYAQASVDFARSRAEVIASRERLNELLGVWGADTAWKISAKMDDVPETEAALEHLESKAIATRYDLRAARADVQAVSYALALTKNTRWVGGLDVGVHVERLSEGVTVLGPTASIALPIFDQGRGAIARVEAQLRQVQNREHALAISIRSEVRKGANRLEVARTVVQSYQRTMVPLRERIVALSQQQYDAMLLGVFQLLLARQNEINTYRELIEALRDYWTARAELEWKVGGDLKPAATTSSSSSPRVAPPAAAPTTKPMSPPAPKGAPAHEHHTP